MSTNRHRRTGCEIISNDVPIIGDGMAISNEHNKAMLETEAFKKGKQCATIEIELNMCTSS